MRTTTTKNPKIFPLNFHSFWHFLGFARVVTRICSRPCARCILGKYNLLYNIYKLGYVRGKEVSLRAASKLISVTTLETLRKYDLILKIDFL